MDGNGKPGSAHRPVQTGLRLFLCGDVMSGRGIDQILPHPCDPGLYEPYVHDARRYLELAEEVNGPVPRPADFDYVWGDALVELDARRPHARVINLETSVTDSDRPWPKGINYRMHPRNLPCLTAAAIDACTLANNHVLDWGRQGLAETLDVLGAAHIATAGAGHDARTAMAPATVRLDPDARLLLFSAATGDSGVPRDWGARAHRAGVNRLPDLSERTVDRLARHIETCRRPGDRVVLSLHWGGNWGFRVLPEQRRFARALVERAGVDLVHGHSSHHVKGLEIHRGHLILYGCGDLINDYEGIGGYAHYRGDLGLMYFPLLDRCDGSLLELSLVPTRVRRFRIEHAPDRDRDWLLHTLRRECGRLDSAAPEPAADGALRLVP
ncbi:MAG TPA: CapA family protein [Gammaproteobacteria bacterium]|nr:CapA family protein [Gammaproteobacteria bacterium]